MHISPYILCPFLTHETDHLCFPTIQVIYSSFIRECFATCEEIEFAKKFKAAINRTFTEKGGVLWQGITDRQLTAYVMQIVKEFSTSPEKKTLWGSLVIGRQPNMRKVDTDGEFVEENDRGDYEEKNDFDSAVYILNENVQVCLLFSLYIRAPFSSHHSRFLPISEMK